MPKGWPKRAGGWLYPVSLLGVITLFILLRIWRLSSPAGEVYDEVYFPYMAHRHLIGRPIFDAHPPLGKLLLIPGELLFGYNSLGWRIMPLSAGVAMIFVMYWVAREVFNDRRVGLLAALFVSIDGFMIIYSRTGLIDGFMLLFGVTSFGFCWRFCRATLSGQVDRVSMLLAGVFSGLTLSIKWIGLGFFALVVLASLSCVIYRSRRLLYDALLCFMFTAVVPIAIYCLWFVVVYGIDFWGEMVEWHQMAWDYHNRLSASHRYGSEWWSWPLLIRPIWLYFEQKNGLMQGVQGIGNPLVWWASTGAVLWTAGALLYAAANKRAPDLVRQKNFLPLLAVLVGWMAFFLPWSRIGRVLFIHHYLTSYLFALLLTAFWIGRLLDTRACSRMPDRARRRASWPVRKARRRGVAVATSRRRNAADGHDPQALATEWHSRTRPKPGCAMALLFLALSVALSIFFLPVWIAYPVPSEWLGCFLWFKTWM